MVEQQEEGSSAQEWMTIIEGAKYVGVTRATLYNYMKDGRLPYYYIVGTNQRRLKKSDIDALFRPGKPGNQA